MPNISITFNVVVNFNNKEITVSGNGTADVCVSGGYYHYTPARPYLSNGDPGYPEEEECEWDEVELDGDIEIDEIDEISCDDLTEEELDNLQDDDSFIEAVSEAIDNDNFSYNDEDIVEYLAERANDRYYDYDDYY